MSRASATALPSEPLKPGGYATKSMVFTAICPRERSDKGKTRKISPEQLLEAIEQVKPFFRGNHFNLAELYRRCIEKGLLRREQIAPNTFRRLVKQFELLTPEHEVSNKKRLAFAKAHSEPKTSLHRWPRPTPS